MKNFNKYQFGMLLASIALIAALILLFMGNKTLGGPALITFFLILAYSIKGYPALKSFGFTVWIFCFTSAAMFYPHLFVSYGNFKLTVLIVPLLQIIMFGMGSQMSFSDFAGLFKNPKGVIVGSVGHFVIMPITSLIVVSLFKFPPEIAAGIILIGCVPNGLASNVMSLICNANIVLAVTVSAITTIFAPFITPFLMKLVGGTYVEINVWKMMLDIVNMTILPIIAGFIFNMFNAGKADMRSKITQLASYFILILLANLIFVKVNNADFAGYLVASAKSLGLFFVAPIVFAMIFQYFFKGNMDLMKKILSLFSMIGIIIILTIITAAGRDALLAVGLLLLLVVFFQNVGGYIMGYSLARLFRLPERDCRTLAFEVGTANAGLASGLALTLGNIATIGLAPAIYGPMMNITGSTLASYWKSKPLTADGKYPLGSGKDIPVVDEPVLEPVKVKK